MRSATLRGPLRSAGREREPGENEGFIPSRPREGMKGPGYQRTVRQMRTR
jgi:hypothetical protein